MRLVVLLSTYNGEPFLAEQLDSLLAQTLPASEIVVRDDGSTDGTPAILDEYQARGALRWYGGENLGPARSFWQLLLDAPEADLYALCDQDDVWDADKLACAVGALEACDSGAPALYCSDVRVVDERLAPIAEHMVAQTEPDLPHALVKNLAPGCTYVFNRVAREMLVRYDPDEYGLELHDWTAYQIVACTGRIIYDEHSRLSYRQHGGNAVGAVLDPRRECFRKLQSFWSGPKKNSRERNARRLLVVYGDEMSAKDRELVADYVHYRHYLACKLRLLDKWARIIAGPERLLFRLLVIFNKL